jgi:hypothetical protein
MRFLTHREDLYDVRESSWKVSILEGTGFIPQTAIEVDIIVFTNYIFFPCICSHALGFVG